MHMRADRFPKRIRVRIIHTSTGRFGRSGAYRTGIVEAKKGYPLAKPRSN